MGAVDPFSPEADPGRNLQPVDGPLQLGRRTVVVALALVPAAAGCTHPRPACPSMPRDAEHCVHRFCRYHRG